MKVKVQVYCQLRPRSGKEISEKERSVLTNVDEFTVEHMWKDDKVKQHMYDHVFDGNATQDDVFEDTKYLVQSAVDGYNVCIFAYRQTGSGKTFTIYGSKSNPGLTPRAISELFRIIKRDSNKFSFTLKSSRSHLILSVVIESTNLQTQSVARGKLSFVDLAGSERVKKSGSSGSSKH
ncbi:Kinesin-like calmodulin-binding protein [Abeliophyllum distichum]|uniref:Kinesin-like calmodulin-binding protein n=1 Tax=Abeliophyllum distichum TaxID=126358 RepID=A0ABD1V3L6_9LAMI